MAAVQQANSNAPAKQSRLVNAIAEAKEAYIRRNPKSLAHYESEATQKLPGGSTRNTLSHPVSSPQNDYLKTFKKNC